MKSIRIAVQFDDLKMSLEIDRDSQENFRMKR